MCAPVMIGSRRIQTSAYVQPSIWCSASSRNWRLLGVCIAGYVNWGLLAGGVFSPWIYGQREGWKEGLNHLYCPTYSRGPFIRSVQNIANRYCTECIIGIVQNAGTPSRLRFARTRRDEG